MRGEGWRERGVLSCYFILTFYRECFECSDCGRYLNNVRFSTMNKRLVCEPCLNKPTGDFSFSFLFFLVNTKISSRNLSTSRTSACPYTSPSQTNSRTTATQGTRTGTAQTGTNATSCARHRGYAFPCVSGVPQRRGDGG
jgi:hypothetical protein